MAHAGDDLLNEVLGAVSYGGLALSVGRELGIETHVARKVVEAFDNFVARPLESNLKRMVGRDLAKRNPMVYTVRGISTVDDWIEHVLADKETSALENYCGTFLEEVVRIVSGGFKPGSGVDLQIDRPDGVVELYAIQTSPTTKNSGGRRADVNSLKRAAKPLRAARRHVDLFVGVLVGQRRNSVLTYELDVTVLSSPAFWERMTGVPDFYGRLLSSTLHLRTLVKARSADEIERIASEARALYGTVSDELNLGAMAEPPPRQKRPPASSPKSP